MPRVKEVIQHDRFRVIASVDEAMVGRLLSVLSRMGVDDVGYELITDVRTFHGNKPRVEGPQATEFATEYLQTKPRFSRRELSAHFAEHGRAPTQAFYAIKMLLDRHVIRKVEGETAVYEVAPKQLPAPSEAAPAQARTNKEAIIAFIAGRRKGQTITSKEVRELFKKEKRNPDSISPIFNALQREKRLKAAGDRGSYVVS